MGSFGGFSPPPNPFAGAAQAVSVLQAFDSLRQSRDRRREKAERDRFEKEIIQLRQMAEAGDESAAAKLRHYDPAGQQALEQGRVNLQLSQQNLERGQERDAADRQKAGLEAAARNTTLALRGLDALERAPNARAGIVKQLSTLGAITPDQAEVIASGGDTSDIRLELEAMDSILKGPAPESELIGIQKRIRASGVDPESDEGRKLVRRELNADLLEKELRNQKLMAERDLKRKELAEDKGKNQPIPTLIMRNIAEVEAGIDVAGDLLDNWGNQTGTFSILTQYFPNTDASKFNDKRAMAAQVIGASLEPGGRMSDADFQKYLAMMPTPGDSKERASQKIKQLQRLLKIRKNSLVQTFASGEGDSGGRDDAAFNEHVQQLIDRGIKEDQAIDIAARARPGVIQ